MVDLDIDTPTSWRVLFTWLAVVNGFLFPMEMILPSSTTVVFRGRPGLFRTALTFFGVRKGICILPSFFGGRSKNQNKWHSKKGISKSKTHDGLCALTEASEYNSQRETAAELQSSCHNECSHSADQQKSLTLGRHKRGLRTLFQSFKQSRGQRNAGLDTTEMIAISFPQSGREGPAVQVSRPVTECLGSEPDVPDFTDVMKCDISIGPECSSADVMRLENSAEKERPKSEHSGQEHHDLLEEAAAVAGVSTTHQETLIDSSAPCVEPQMGSPSALKSEIPHGSSDGLNLFEDVASLKSFDSLTGCGDITADQEDDSITDSTVSGERSRNGGKRASCYLTYQGGGEEMASPEDFDETCLQEFWGNNDAICCTCNPDQTDTNELTSSHNLDSLNSSSAQQAVGRVVSSTADALTPQSEHQESFPNSDEGYYDSTTPGPQEGQEEGDGLRAGRLPRDSYSGDALYELFAPDESLISPHYQSKSPHPNSKSSTFLSEPEDEMDAAFVPEMNRLLIGAELYAESFLERPESGKSTGNQRESKHYFTFKTTFGSSSHPDYETFCRPKEEHLEENKPVALPYKNKSSPAEESTTFLDDGQTVCFSQALEDYTKHTQILGNNADDLDRNSTFTPNMEALPTIVTFDVVDMHNEGEYDEQMRMDLEEDISSPYQEFEESYLQKDGFAECDYQMFDLYEHNLISNAWAVASLPRQHGVIGVSQSVPHTLTHDKRSRSLDTEGPNVCTDTRAAVAYSSQLEEGSSSLPYSKKNIVMSSSEAGNGKGIMSSSWHPRTDEDVTVKVQSLSSHHSSSGDFFDLKPHHLCTTVSDDTSCDFMSHNPDSSGRQRHFPVLSDSCGPQGTLVYAGMTEQVRADLGDRVFCNTAHMKSFTQSSKGRAEGASLPQSPLKGALCKDKTSVLCESQAM
uniref:APC membrane recruitment protein 1 n=1 Tax=Oryzias latipes TaxID=8090 RepID=A0A3P9LJ69_ORYLA